MADINKLIEVKNLNITFKNEEGEFSAVSDLSLSICPQETVALVGESGCGKSITSLSIMKLLPAHKTKVTGEILFNGKNILTQSEKDLCKVRGNEISFIFQEPMTALNPVYTIGQQIDEVFRVHKGMSRKAAKEQTISVLSRVKIPDPHLRYNDYPFQLSGGMRQRVLIAMAIALNPKLIIADEPTTALDVTIQAQILHLLLEIQKEYKTSILFVTHDLGLVCNFADQVCVMYAGRIVEQGAVKQVFQDPKHPYTRALLHSIPKPSDHKTQPLNTIGGSVPSITNQPSGCRFHPRCSMAIDKCKKEEPLYTEVADKHWARCFRAGEKF